MKKIIYGLFALLSIAVAQITYADIVLPAELPAMGTPVELLRQKGVKVYKHKKDLLDIQQPNWIQMSQTGIQKLPTWSAYWIDRLPYAQDHDANAYIVIPRLGVVAPIIDIPTQSLDYKHVAQWLSIDFNTYLQNGIIHYPSASLWSTGNVIMAGHSSYWRADAGRYKTIFASLPLLDFGDQIWSYTKNTSWGYDRYIYMVQKSYETPASNIEVLQQTKTKTLTLFTCVPIGTVESRWIVTATQVQPPKRLVKTQKIISYVHFVSLKSYSHFFLFIK